MRLAGLLQKHEIAATFFIPIKNSEGYPVMLPSQMRELSDTFEIGSHTHDHYFLNSVNMPQARYQVTEGKQKLEDILGKAVPGFCFPGGKYDKNHLNIVKQAGFQYARTTTNLCFDAGENRFEIPTTCQFYPHKKSVYVRNFIKGMHWKQRKSGLLAVLQQDLWMDRMYALLEHAYTNKAVFHLWVHSHNIDDLQLWGELDAFLAHVSTLVGKKERITNAQLATRFFAK